MYFIMGRGIAFITSGVPPRYIFSKVLPTFGVRNFIIDRATLNLLLVEYQSLNPFLLYKIKLFFAPHVLADADMRPSFCTLNLIAVQVTASFTLWFLPSFR